MSCLMAFSLIKFFSVALAKFFLGVSFGGSDNKASAWNAGVPGSISGLEGSPGEGNGNPL